MTTTQTRKLVRLRTVPMPDPGEWCFREAWLSPRLSRYVRCRHCIIGNGNPPECALGHRIPLPDRDKSVRRPKECIDSAEVET